MNARRVVAILFLLGIIFGLQMLPNVSATSTALVGFVLLAAYALAELTSSLKLPRVTGYILAGIAVGPFTSGLVDAETVSDFQVFNELALALIALEAGLELQISSLKKVAKTLGAIVAVKIPLSWLFIGGAFVAAAPLLPDGGALSMSDKIAVGLVLGAIGVGTSPAVSIAVISELKAKNRLADLVLGLAVAKDVVMIVMLATAITIAGALAPDSQGFDLGVFKALGIKVALSVGAGVVLGGALIAWLRFVKWEMVLVLLLVGYGGTYLAETLHLKPLLVFIGAGFTVANFSKYGHDLHEPLALVAVPVFVVFFTTVGEGLDLGAAVSVAPVVGIVFAARLGMLALATRLGGKLAGEPPGFTRRTWPAFVSQAGVALGLLLIARDGLPQYDAVLAQVGTVLVGCNLLIGPILLRLSLTRAVSGDVPKAKAAAKVREARLPVDAELIEVHTRTRARVHEALGAVDAGVVQGWLGHAERMLELVQASGAESTCVSIEGALQPLDVASAARTLDTRARDLRDWIETLPVGQFAPMTDEHLVDPVDIPQRLRAFWLRPSVRRGQARRWVPVRELCRQRVEGIVLPELADVLARVAVREAERIDALSLLADEVARRSVDVDERIAELRADLRQVAAALSQEVRECSESIAVSVGNALADGGSPRLPASELQFSDVARDVDAAVNRLSRAEQTLGRMLAGVQGRASVRLSLAKARRRLGDILEADFERWHTEVVSPSMAQVGEVRVAAASCQARLGDWASSDLEQAREGVRVDAATFDAEIVAGLPKLDELRNVSRDEPPLAGFEAELPKVVAGLPETVRAVPARWELTPKNAWNIPSESVRVREHLKERAGSELDWSLRDVNDRSDRLVARVAHRLGEVAGLAADGYSAAVQALDAADPLSGHRLTLMPADAALRRVVRALDRLGSELDAGVGLLRSELIDALDATLLGTETDALGDRRAGRSRVVRARRVGEAIESAVARTSAFVGSVVRQPAVLVARVRNSAFVRDLALLEGRDRLDPHHMRAEVQQLAPSLNQATSLPYLLRRFFAPGALSDLGATPVAADAAVQGIRNAWERFNAGEPVSILLSGPEGSGKSSVAQATLRYTPNTELIRIELGLGSRTEAELSRIIATSIGAFGVASFEALEKALLRQPKRVFLLDPFEELFSRTPAGLEHVRRVLELIENTRHAVCWVVCINGSARYLLDRLCHLSHAFTDRVVFPRLGARDLARIMENRAQLAGFRVEYPAPRTVSSWFRALLRTGGRVAELRRYAFYDDLARAAGGNIADATNFWIRHIEAVDGDVVYVQPVRVPRLAWFGQLGRDAHRLLALAIVSGGITRREAIGALRWSEDRLAPEWSLLHATGLFRPMVSEPDRFEVWPPAWRTVTDQLVATGELPSSRDATEEEEL